MEFLRTSPGDKAKCRLLLAHGAAAPMDSRFMNEMSSLLAERGIDVLRFEFAYMAARRQGGKRRPPPMADLLLDEYRAAVASAGRDLPLLIGGKSMGGRVASMIADACFRTAAIKALVCLGYPFHPPAKPDAPRVTHLQQAVCPALIVQGERDPFGNRAEVEALSLPSNIKIEWIGDGDHDFGPRGASGYTRKANLIAVADALSRFADQVGG